MNENLEIKKDNTNKGLLFTVVGVLTLIVAIAGATYAFFTASASNTTAITGTAASGGLTLTITKEAGGTGKLIPQLSSAINAAATANCVDGNSNTVCQIYSIKVTSNSTASVALTGTISFGGITNMGNLKFATSNSKASGYSTTGTKAATSATSLSNFSLAANGTKTIYLIVWIEEKNTAQSDSGTFTATVTFNSSAGGGITSTITS